MLALLYLTLICAGSLLLRAPLANTGGVTWMDALFTATSAVAVTGLTVVDTGTGYTLFGQGVIALLIQLGGLGLMTFAALVLSALGISIGMPQRVILREDLNQTSVSNLLELVRAILKIAIVCELVGVAVLSTVFMPQFGLAQGLWHAVFHTVSAFNNAGFALFPDSLSGYVGNPVVNFVIPALFLTGGLGFVVIGDILEKRRWRTLMLHTKLMLVGSAGLILWGSFAFAFLEWNNSDTLQPLPLGTKLMASWFQGVTPRTAGFNTLDLSRTHDSTSLLIMGLMLIGGGSASTAGGLKVTTFMVLLLGTLAFLKRRNELHAFGRRIGLEEVLKVMALTTISALTIMLALFVVAISHDGEFMDLAFEICSAFGTTGLSRGATGELDTLGRLVVMIVMFLGRVGPLTLGFFLATRSMPRLRYPEGQVYLG